jgi:hypothetical protein
MKRLVISIPSPETLSPGDRSVDHSATLIEDVLNASLLTAATASIANSISMSPSSPLPLTALVSCLPPLPISSPAYATRFESRWRDDEASTALAEFIEALRAARELSQLVSLSSARGRHSLPTGVTLLASDWRSVARLADMLVRKLLGIFNAELSELLCARAELTLRLLAAVCQGESPCIGETGQLSLPEPFERRSATRSTSQRDAYFSLHGGTQRAFVLNASRQGLGVRGLSNGQTGDPITLLAGSGLMATGRITWLRGDQAGIRFDQALPETLLSSLIH